MHSPFETISHTCALMKDWAGLQKEIDRELLIQGADTMFKIAVKLLAERQAAKQTNMIQDSAEEEDEDQDPEV